GNEIRLLDACRAVKSAIGESDPPTPQPTAPTSGAIIEVNSVTPSGPQYNIPFEWSDVSQSACNTVVAYELEVRINGQIFSGVSTQAQKLTLSISNPSSFTGWTWTVKAVDKFGNKTVLGPSDQGAFRLRQPSSGGISVVTLPASSITATS